ncbi:MAG: hypothetical protein FWG64_06995 [Firmicutes bacterium]|nr:hypothetical protein [Bacillota bacterium]
MNSGLQKFYEKDEGFRQFVDRFNYLTSIPEEREKILKWQIDAMQQEEIATNIEEKQEE